MKDLAERAIADALNRYCTAVDSYDTKLFLTLWTAEAQLDFGERYQGAPAGFMASLVEARSRTIAMTHQIEEVTIVLSSDLFSATSNSVVAATVTRSVPGGEQRRLVRGRYDDQWEFTEGKWLIRHRVYRGTEETLLPSNEKTSGT